jgi:hypothetical protein
MTRQVKIIELFSRINFIVQLWSDWHVIIPSELLQGPIHEIKLLSLPQSDSPKLLNECQTPGAKLSYQDLRMQMP